MGLDASVYRDNQEEHQIASVRLGNAELIARLFDVISQRLPAVTVLLKKVLYSGTHAGDRISLEEVGQLRRELMRSARPLTGMRRSKLSSADSVALWT
jgi:hypothetical protein